MSKARKSMKPSASNVSKVLSGKPHYFQKSTSYPSAIRGWKNYSSGFVCEKTDNGGCTVRYHTDGIRNEVAQNAYVERYQKALEPAFAVEILNGVFGLCLKVSEKAVQP